MRRTTLLSVLILFLVGCTYYRTQTTCPGRNAAPIVCIDASLNAHPDPVQVRRGQWVHFFLERGELKIESDVLENQGQDGGQAWGRVKKEASYGLHKYTVINQTTGKQNDPNMEIVP
jgi:hypothetical protein